MKLTPKRCQEIIDQSHQLNTSKYGTWVDFISLVITKEEDEEVNQLLETMPGDRCWVDAFYLILNRDKDRSDEHEVRIKSKSNSKGILEAVCKNKEAAEKYAQMLKSEFGEPTFVVKSKG